MTIDEIGYALSKQVPAMRREVILHTHYGELHLHDEEAAQVAVLVKQILEAKLRKLLR